MKDKTLFLAEDDQEDVELLQDILTDLNTAIALQVASNGVELMTMLQESKTPPDLILLDLNMPLKNGMVCLQEIKSNELWKQIRVVVLSTSSVKQQMDEAYQKGADMFLTKSTSYTEFKNAIASCLQATAIQQATP